MRQKPYMFERSEDRPGHYRLVDVKEARKLVDGVVPKKG